MIWLPHVTVAAIVKQQDRYLLVHETAEDGDVINQPAGHLEDRENLQEAIIREVREETGHPFTPDFIVGIYQYRVPASGITYLRYAFAGQVAEKSDTQTDPEIIETLWLNRQELENRSDQLRSPLVMQTINDFESGQRYPLDLVRVV